MVWSHLITISLSLGWMLSADVFVRLGNGVAQSRTLFLASLGFAALLSAFAVSLIRHPGLRKNGKASTTGLLVQGIGKLPAMTITLGSRLALVLILPTGLLVTAGFAFNEIFLYWFPNFGFSFLILAGVCLLHLLGEKVARAAQPVFMAVVLICMLILCFAGLGGAASGSPISVDIGFSVSASALLGSFLLFLGYDHATPTSSADSRLPGFGALFFALMIFIFWSMLSLQYVEAERLADSTVPHLLTAKKILGQPGRILIGTAVISGTFGLVNMLFHLASRTLGELAERNLLPYHPPGLLKRRRYILLFTLIIGSFLLGGLAGHDILETYIQATLILWLFHTGMLCLSASRLLHARNIGQPLPGFGLGITFVLCSVFLAATDPQAAVILRFTFFILSAGAIISALWLRKGPVVEVLQTQSENHKGELS